MPSHDEPARVLDALLVGLGVAQRRQRYGAGLRNLVCRAVADEDGLAPPLDNNVLALRDRGQPDLDLGQRQHVCRRRHGPQEILHRGLGRRSTHHAHGPHDKVRRGAVAVSVAIALAIKS